MWLGDPLTGAIAYVPRGAIKRGEDLVRHGARACTSCHGASLKGLGNVPPLAGRNPQYLSRQLWDIKSGARGGPAVALMQQPMEAISADQIVDVVAYLTSLTP
jgi:cytochrome c553